MVLFGLRLLGVGHGFEEIRIRLQSFQKVGVLGNGDFIEPHPEFVDMHFIPVLVGKVTGRNQGHLVEVADFRPLVEQFQRHQSGSQDCHPGNDAGLDGFAVFFAIQLGKIVTFSLGFFNPDQGFDELIDIPDAVGPVVVLHAQEDIENAFLKGGSFALQHRPQRGSEDAHLLTRFGDHGGRVFDGVGNASGFPGDENALGGQCSETDSAAFQIAQNFGAAGEHFVGHFIIQLFICFGHRFERRAIDHFHGVEVDSALLGGFINQGNVLMGDQCARAGFLGEGIHPGRIPPVFSEQCFQGHAALHGNLLSFVNGDVVIRMNHRNQSVVSQKGSRFKGSFGQFFKSWAILRGGFIGGGRRGRGYLCGGGILQCRGGGLRFGWRGFLFNRFGCRCLLAPGRDSGSDFGEPGGEGFRIHRLVEEFFPPHLFKIGDHVETGRQRPFQSFEMLQQNVPELEGRRKGGLLDSQNHGVKFLQGVGDLPSGVNVPGQIDVAGYLSSGQF